MITHDQMIYTLSRLLDGVSEKEHGTKFWVAMPVEGDKQIGEAWIVKWDYEDIPEPTFEEISAKWEEVKDDYFYREASLDVRRKRDALLEESDVLFRRALEQGADTTAISAYSQALRDIPEQEGFPFDVVWPQKP